VGVMYEMIEHHEAVIPVAHTTTSVNTLTLIPSKPEYPKRSEVTIQRLQTATDVLDRAYRMHASKGSEEVRDLGDGYHRIKVIDRAAIPLAIPDSIKFSRGDR
jgi:hypothetical protein